jgi:hypothetical protein
MDDSVSMNHPRWPCAGLVGDWLCSNLAFESLVAGHYQPLADNPGIAPESDQTRSLQSDQRTLQNRLRSGFAVVSKESFAGSP